MAGAATEAAVVGIANMSLKADLNDDGVFEADWSSYLRAVRDVGLSRRAAVDRFGPRGASFTLDNTDSRFSPRKASGPYYPNLKKGKRVQLSTVVTAPAIVNLCPNPSFETNLTGWAEVDNGAASMVPARVASSGRYGRSSLELVNSAGGEDDYEWIRITPTVSVTYTVSAWLYVSAITAAALSNRGLGIWDGTTDLYTTLDTSHAVGRWVRHTKSLAVGGGATFLEIRLYGPQGTVYWDGIQIEQAATASAYIDGDQPACTWSGTAHGSTSSRAANPTIYLFTGELRDLDANRRRMVGRATYGATGLVERALGQEISAGPFSRTRAQYVVRRLLDIMEKSALIRDGALRFGGETWTAVGATTEASFDAAQDAGADPVNWYSLEGDRVLRLSSITAGGQGAQVDLLPKGLLTGVNYRFACFVGTRDANAVGQSVHIIVQETGATGPGTSADVVLPAVGQWGYCEISGTFSNGSPASRTMQITSTGSGWTGSPDAFMVDGIHIGLTKDKITERLLGTKWSTVIEYLDAFHKSAGEVLRELADSVGGWFYEAGDGALVFEDYSQRDPAVVTVPKLRLSDVPDDGEVFHLESYAEPASSLAGTVKVGSFGDVSSSPAPVDVAAKVVWSLEPVPVALTSNEVRIFYADYVAEEETGGGMIARRAAAVALPISGWASEGASPAVATPYVINYGRSGEVVVKAPGGGLSVYRLLLPARVLNRQTTERVFVQVGSAQPLMELEMPAQGYRTQAMTDFATWAYNKYNPGPALVEGWFEGMDTESLLQVFARDIGLPVWLRHVQGQGALYLDGLYFVEGWHLDADGESLPRLSLTLEEAPGA